MASLSKTLSKAATVDLYDDTEGIFGELIHPLVVVCSLERALDHHDLVGRVDETAGADGVPTEPMRSLDYANSENDNSFNADVGLEIDNTSNETLRIRWVDTEGNNPSSHVWTIQPMSSFVQSTRPGHLFLISAIASGGLDLFESSEELVLGAYRPIRQLPSGSSHCILIQQQESTAFLVETMLLDGTKKDALIVAASALDPLSSTPCRKKTILTLKTIVHNVLTHPTEEKYRRLRLGNHKLQRDICSSWGAMHFLQALGFHSTFLPMTEQETSDNKDDGKNESQTEEYLQLTHSTLDETQQTASLLYAQELLDLLETRSDPHFVAELAPPAPWQKPVPVGASHNRWNTEGTHFITDEERWARAERVGQARASGRGRVPRPGEAPSSRGTWGR